MFRIEICRPQQNVRRRSGLARERRPDGSFMYAEVQGGDDGFRQARLAPLQGAGHSFPPSVPEVFAPLRPPATL
jgi:hypothetical protein